MGKRLTGEIALTAQLAPTARLALMAAMGRLALMAALAPAEPPGRIARRPVTRTRAACRDRGCGAWPPARS
jgi:hypothetical protein